VKNKILYLAFFGIVTVFFLYYFFPKEQIENYLDYQVFRIDPDLRLAVGDLRLSIPPYAGIDDAIVSYRRQPVVRISSARVRPGLGAILKRGTLAAFKGHAHKGRFDGEIIRGDMTAARVDLSDIEIDDIDGMQSIPGVSLSGRMTGRIILSEEDARPGPGRIDLTVSDCTVALARALFDIKMIRFDQIELKLDLKGPAVRIRRLEMKGPQMNATFEGQVELQSPFNSSRLKLTGKIQPHAEFMVRLKKKIPEPLWPSKQLLRSGVPITISGTIAKPAFGLK